jgi:hypothetical protein
MKLLGVRVKANALQYVLIIGVVISILLFSVILYLHYSSLLSIQHRTQIDAISSHQNHFFRMIEDSEELRPWGAFLIRSSSKDESSPYLRKGLVSHKWHASDLPQVFIPDKNNYLQISGATSLKGILSVPKSEIRTGNVAGRIYEGLTSDGFLLKPSGERLPNHPLNDKNSGYWMSQTNDSILSWNEMDLQHSFYDRTIRFYSQNQVQLVDVKLTGNIIIQSETEIIVDKSSSLQDVQLIAPVVKVTDDTKGSFQIIATDTVSIGSRVEMQFPSSIVMPKGSDESTSFIEVGKNVKFSGGIIQTQVDKDNLYKLNLKIQEDAEINGTVYNAGSTELKGSINGSVMTEEFLTFEKGSVYRNLVLDGVVKKEGWTEEYLRLSEVSSELNQPLKWLY